MEKEENKKIYDIFKENEEKLDNSIKEIIEKNKDIFPNSSKELDNEQIMIEYLKKKRVKNG